MHPSPRLASRLAQDFDTSVRTRGYEYYRSGMVRIVTGTPTVAEGTVSGSEIYDVGAVWKDGVLTMYCSCPYFEDKGPCKHLWALILKADADGHLVAARLSRNLMADYDSLGPEGEETGDTDEAFDADDVEIRTPMYYRGKPYMLPRPAIPKKPDWRQELAAVSAPPASGSNANEVWPAKRELVYVVDVASSERSSSIALELLTRDRKKDGAWGKFKDLRLARRQIPLLGEAEDRDILSILTGTHQSYTWGEWYDSFSARFQLLDPVSRLLVERMARTGRCHLRLSAGDPEPTAIGWDDGGAWQFGLEVKHQKNGKWGVGGTLRRGEEKLDVKAPVLVTPGLVFLAEKVAPLEPAQFRWILRLRKDGGIEVPAAEKEELLGALLAAPLSRPRLETPPELQYDEVRLTPIPCLAIRAAKKGAWVPDKLRAQFSFDYGGVRVSAEESSGGIFRAAERRFLVRDTTAEAAARERLTEAGLRFSPVYDEPEFPWELHPAKLPRAAHLLVEAGWRVEADGKMFRRPGASRMSVSSGVDWFELHGEVDYEGTSAKLPELLEALRRGDKMVRLGDGTYGLLPEEWLSRFGPLAGMGAAAGDHMRFRRSQAGLLDALLATQPEVDCDQTFARVREQLREFEGLRAADQPECFVGTLRDYQREGLGWMNFLRRFGFGGCLADDMGVGKTAQVLALLETRRQMREDGGANGAGEEPPAASSLVVVPRSLVFNWKAEAARFTPRLRVLDYTGVTRASSDFSEYDLVLTTYGTLRRDAMRFKDVEFDYVVLDEAQAIKNAGTESAKAARLLRGRHRLALSGTPVENHLGELWSLFEFLNPGILGSAGVFKLAGDAARNPGDDTRRLLAHALRPFILRRTKDQVARELPAKTEQTIFCELEPAQRKHYNELRQHYRNSLLRRIETDGLAKSKIQVLEALLRLRQAACHSGLIDSRRVNEPSAKLDVLMEQLEEVLEEGHKALVFSQFTSLLDLVRQRLDSRAVVYEYLDGATRDRQRRVERFQNDPACPLFLISLKAGGLGLNLTAAEYVFLLDPWWNPAVEAQAIDRAHRIGQERQVFAYRLIARDTVEEKVLELQSTKRDLAAAIINADNSLIRDLKREDLELLLS